MYIVLGFLRQEGFTHTAEILREEASAHFWLATPVSDAESGGAADCETQVTRCAGAEDDWPQGHCGWFSGPQ